MQKDLKMQSITKQINEMIKIQYITLNDQQQHKTKQIAILSFTIYNYINLKKIKLY